MDNKKVRFGFILLVLLLSNLASAEDVEVITVYVKDQNGDDVVQNSNLIGNLTVEIWYEGKQVKNSTFDKKFNHLNFTVNHTGLYTVTATAYIKLIKDDCSLSQDPVRDGCCASEWCRDECYNGDSQPYNDSSNLTYHCELMSLNCNATACDPIYEKYYILPTIGIAQTYVKRGESDMVRIPVLTDERLLWRIARLSKNNSVLSGGVDEWQKIGHYAEEKGKAVLFEVMDQVVQATIAYGSQTLGSVSTVTVNTVEALTDIDKLATPKGQIKYGTNVVVGVFNVVSGASPGKQAVIFVAKEIGFDVVLSEDSRCDKTKTDDLSLFVSDGSSAQCSMELCPTECQGTGGCLLPIPTTPCKYYTVDMINHADIINDIKIKRPATEMQCSLIDSDPAIDNISTSEIVETHADWIRADGVYPSFTFAGYALLDYSVFNIKGGVKCRHEKLLKEFNESVPYISSAEYPDYAYPNTVAEIKTEVVDNTEVLSVHVNWTYGSEGTTPMSKTGSGMHTSWTGSLQIPQFQQGQELRFLIQATDTDQNSAINDNDQRMYGIQVVEDANSGRDAGESWLIEPEDSISVTPNGEDVAGYLIHDIESVDTYHFLVEKGQQIDAEFVSDNAASMSLLISNGYQMQNLVTLKSENNTLDSKYGRTADISGTAYLSVVKESSQNELATYSFSVYKYGTPWVDPTEDGFELEETEDFVEEEAYPEYTVDQNAEIVRINGEVASGVVEINHLYAKPNADYTYKGYIKIDEATFPSNPIMSLHQGKFKGCVVTDTDKTECANAINPEESCREESGYWVCDRYYDYGDWIESLYIPATSLLNGNTYDVYIGNYTYIDEPGIGENRWVPKSQTVQITLNSVDFPPKDVSISSNVTYNSVPVEVTVDDESPDVVDIYLDGSKIINDGDISSGTYVADVWDFTDKIDGTSHDIHALVRDAEGSIVKSKTIQTSIRVDSTNPLIGDYLGVNPTSGGTATGKIAAAEPAEEYVRGTVRLSLPVSDNESGIAEIKLNAKGECSPIYPAGSGSTVNRFSTEGIPKVFAGGTEPKIGQSSAGGQTYCNVDLTEESGSVYWNTTGLDGEGNLTYTVKDRAGNEVTKTFTVNVDNTAPDITEVDVDDPIRDSTILNVTATDAGAGIGEVKWYLWDSGRRKIGSYQTTLWGTTGLNGTYTLEVEVTDRVGNTASHNETITIWNSADLWPYVVKVNNATAGLVTINATIFNFGYRSADNFAVEFRVDGNLEDSRSISLTPMKNQTIDFSWTAVQGEPEISIEVDPQNIITEGYKGDNIERFELVVYAAGCNPSDGNWTIEQFTECLSRSINMTEGGSLVIGESQELHLENTKIRTKRIVFSKPSKITGWNSSIYLSRG